MHVFSSRSPDGRTRRRIRSRTVVLLTFVTWGLLIPAPAFAAFGFIGTWGKDVDTGGGTGFEVCTASCKTGASGGGAGEFNSPIGLAVDAAGSVYVVDYSNHRVQQFTASGAFVRAFGTVGGGAGQLTFPRGVAVDGAGNVYVVDTNNQRVEQFAPTGAFVRAWGRDVDTGGGTGFEICTASCQAGTAGGGAGDFNNPVGVAVDVAGNVYVADFGNARTQQFTAAGTFERTWGKDVDTGGGTGFEICTATCQAGTSGGQAGELAGPNEVVVDGAGNVYVADYFNNRVQQFTASGAFVRSWGKNVDIAGGTGFEICSANCQAGAAGGGAGELNFPTDVTVDGAGNVYVADRSNHRVQQFTASGAFVRTWGKDVDTGGFTGFEVCTASCQTGIAGGTAGEFNNPNAVAVDCRSAVYVTDTSNNRVQKFGEPADPPAPCVADGGGGPGGGGGGPTALAAITALGISPRTFRAASGGPPARDAGRRRARIGARVSYTLNEAASVRFRVERRAKGRRVRRGRTSVCVPPTRKNRNKRRCTRYVTLKGSFSDSGPAGTNRLRFSGRLRGKKLRPGRYRLVATPTAGGRTGRPAKTSFRIVR